MEPTPSIANWYLTGMYAPLRSRTLGGMSVGPIVLGIDQGLSGARAVVMASSGQILGTGRSACLDVRPTPGGLEHDASAWLEESVTAARRASAEAGVESVDAIGIGALGPAPVLLDAALQPLASSPLFPLGPAEPLRDWAEHDPAVVERAVWLVDVCGFLVSAFVGRPVLDRITSVDHVVPEGWRSLLLPDVEEPFALAGGLTIEAATMLGLAEGTPVTVGTYDTFVDLAALGVSDLGDRGILLGSTLIVGDVRATTVAPHGLRASPHVGRGSFVGGWTQAAGRALAWWLDLFPDQRRAEIASEAASLPPGAGGLLALPYLDGERAPVWDPGARGAFVGLTTATTSAQMYRATIDAVALSAADLADRLDPSASDAGPWRVGGGGVHDAAWLHATVDAVGEPMLVADLTDANGAARSAFRALGVAVPELATRRVEPDPARHALYARLLPVYRGMYGALESTVRALATDVPR
jgi:xylulokinase